MKPEGLSSYSRVWLCSLENAPLTFYQTARHHIPKDSILHSDRTCPQVSLLLLLTSSHHWTLSTFESYLFSAFPPFCLIHFIVFLSSTRSAQSDVGSNFIQTTDLQSNKSVTSFIDCVLFLRTGKSAITKWVGGQQGMWVFRLFDGAERWKAPELWKDALTKPQVCTQLTFTAVGSHFVFVGTVEW